MENVTGRRRAGRSVEEEEGSGKEREERRTERDGGSGVAGGLVARRGEVRVSEAVAGVRGGGDCSRPSHPLAHTHAHAHARPDPAFGGA
ncbi:hypothetical protein E2C01_025613 [Portunus trituberculatus]|uniref:Uncharacterized protein n=1 Tax=Portunus trituberculatus TaxID=210409 RepID=A0A5B7EGX5_PORTR|nr:hypothetical protein [Portunus trituberculatus]